MSGVLNILVAIKEPAIWGATLNADTYITDTASPAQAWAGFLLSSDGYVYSYSGTDVSSGTYTQEYQWLTGDGNAADYAAYADLTGGNNQSGSDPLDTWVGLAADRVWFSARIVAGATTSTYSVRIRDAATSTTRAGPTTITLQTTMT